ncbi:MAG: PTS transporter subunit EIIC [Anaerorhabdus sp.]
MKKWHALMEVLQIPLKALFVAVLFLGIGNLIINPIFSPYWVVQNKYILIFAEILVKLGSFFILYLPFFFLIRLVARRVNGIVTISMGLAGYFTFLVCTMFFANPSLTDAATSGMFGLSVSNSRVPFLTGTHYPLQTGLIGVILITLTTRIAYTQSRKKHSYGILSFVDKDLWGMILNCFYGVIVALVVSVFWTFFIDGFKQVVSFIATDITNPINLFVYGGVEKILSTFGLSALIRNPFWFTSSGGTWSSIVGSSVTGDVSIWTSMISQNLVPAGFGRFITPTYVINMFAIPGMIWAMYSMYTDKLEKRKIRLFFVLATLASLFCGITLPLELLLFLLSPLLYLFHVIFSASLFGIFQALKISLGFSFSGNSLLALPGTILEFLNYVRNPNYQETVIIIIIIGIASLVVYYAITKIYFRYLAIDLFQGGKLELYTNGTIEAMGGIDNIRRIHSSVNRIIIQVFDQNNIDLFKTRELGASRIVETKAGISLDYGPGSTIIKREIEKKLKDTRRIVSQ